MNSIAPYPSPTAANTSPAAGQTDRNNFTDRPSPGCVHILLSIEVPDRWLPQIETDWARVTQARADAPDQELAAIRRALARLQEHVVAVPAAAVKERGTSPFADWMIQRAAELAA